MMDFEHCTFPGNYSPYETRGECVFNADAAHRAILFFGDELRHVKGGDFAGKPFRLEEWQQKLIATLFGWKRPNGTRRYRYAYVEIPRKAGKSLLACGVALYLLYVDDEPGGEVYSVAGERAQAAIVFDLAKQNVQQNETFDSRSKVYLRSITTYDPRGLPRGSYKVLSAEAGGKHGYNSNGIIFDELHVQRNDKLWEALRSGVGARSQPLTFVITTAGYDRNSLCWKQRELACNVRDGILPNETILPVIYGAELSDDWKDPKVWKKAQPNLGISVPLSFYEDECKIAQQSPSYENTFKRLYLNIWTEQSERWLPMDAWDAVTTPLGDLSGEQCWGGLDLSTTTDLSAFVLAFPMGNCVAVLPFFWIPEERAKKAEQRDRVPYSLWQKQGHIRFTPGNIVDYDFIRKEINDLQEKYDIQDIAVDRWNATQLVTQLEKDGFNVALHGQGMASMAGPTKEFEKLVLAKQLVHGGHPVLRWNASNVAVQTDAAGNIKPTKEFSSGRIDGIVASVMAVGRATTSAPDPAFNVGDAVSL